MLQFSFHYVATCTGELDYTPINSTNGDVRVTMDQQRRRACFLISIMNDGVVEDPETFSLLLQLDPATAENVSDTAVQISPSVAYVAIEGMFGQYIIMLIIYMTFSYNHVARR